MLSWKNYSHLLSNSDINRVTSSRYFTETSMGNKKYNVGTVNLIPRYSPFFLHFFRFSFPRPSVFQILLSRLNLNNFPFHYSLFKHLINFFRKMGLRFFNTLQIRFCHRMFGYKSSATIFTVVLSFLLIS